MKGILRLLCVILSMSACMEPDPVAFNPLEFSPPDSLGAALVIGRFYGEGEEAVSFLVPGDSVAKKVTYFADGTTLEELLFRVSDNTFRSADSVASYTIENETVWSSYCGLPSSCISMQPDARQ